MFRFETIRNNTALKRRVCRLYCCGCFETIRNNTALKLATSFETLTLRFETIRNNTALKHDKLNTGVYGRFETIRNNTALKPRRLFFVSKSRNRAIRLSQTSVSNSFYYLYCMYLFYHIFR